MAAPEESIRDALLFALDDLQAEDFKRFKNKLCFLKMEGRAPIPWSMLERADTIDTAQLLLETYGEEGAWKVTVHVFKATNLRDSATRLQKWKGTDGRKKYQRHLQNACWLVPELGPDPGPTAGLLQKYTELVLARNPPLPERAHELMVSGKKHRKMEAHLDGGGSGFAIESLFDSGAKGKSSRTAVLFGPAGVGKTTAMRKLMLDWASAHIWQTKFEYVFYISCRALSGNKDKTLSLVELLLSCCPAGTLIMEDILMNQGSILIIIDGFDELNPRDLLRDMQGPNEPHKKQPAANLVVDLLKKKLLAPCHLIVTTRPMALASLLHYLRLPQLVEVLGFQPAQRKEYFLCFFENKEEGTQVFELVRSNETLFDMCFLPIVCWITCSIFSKGLQKELLQGLPKTATLTDINMMLLLGLLGCPSRLSDLKGLCRLAKDGMLGGRMVYDEEVLQEHGLEPSSASRRVFNQDAYIPGMYSFIHLSFQEFLAAMFYLLDSDWEPGTLTRELKEAFGDKKGYSCCYGMLIRFLFGLSNTKRQSILQKNWNCEPTSGSRLQQELLNWMEEEAQAHSFKQQDQLLELCHCAYELNTSQFSKSLMGHIRDLDLRDHLSTKLDLAALAALCLSASVSLHSFRLSGYELGLSEFRQLSPGLLKSSEIQLNRCGLTPPICKDLAVIVVDNQNLNHLDLSENALDDSGIIHLCDGLMDPYCKLLCLRLRRCNLTAASCKAFSKFLASNPWLTELDLSENHLGDEGVGRLCGGLKHPQSRLQKLMLHLCGLTDATCKDLAFVLETSRTLVELGLGDNSLGDGGVRQLCAAMKKPHCTLQSLSLSMGSLNRNTKKKLEAVHITHPQITLTPYYPPDFPVFKSGEE